MQKIILAVVLVLGLVYAQNSILTGPHLLLTATGLSTPWLNNLNQTFGCNQAFVQGSWFDSATNLVSAYNPLVTTTGFPPAVAPTVPTVPATATVALWFGYNGNTLTLADNNGGADLAAGNCVNGLVGSIFGQYAYCNAVAFFAAAIPAVAAGNLKIPPLGTANDGQTCPTSRDFFVIDMDQSDNVVTTYLVTTTQQVAQGTVTNQNLLGPKVITTLANGSDIRLVSVAMAAALGCTPYKVPDMAEVTATNNVPTYGTVELQANTYQAAPIALTPISHAMTRVNNQPSLTKTNAYRAGAGQTQATTVAQADGTIYCNNLYFVGPLRLLGNAQSFQNFGSPMPAVATNLYAFLVQRMFTSFGPDGLNCAALLNVANPITPVKNMGGLFVGGTIVPPNQTTTGGLPTNTIIIIVVCTVVGSLLIVGLVAGALWYRNRSMYS
jgi:hypothetical protein